LVTLLVGSQETVELRASGVVIVVVMDVSLVVVKCVEGR